KNYEAEPSDVGKELQDVIRRSDHLAMVFPMWMGTMPAKTKALIEQIFRPGFGLSTLDGEGFPKRLMKGKSARIIMTMGMPVIAYRLYFKAHGLKNIQRNMLGFCGFDPIRTTLLGGVENMSQDAIKKRIAAVRALGAAGA
ncbi:MAG: NAD(P)H-dependent oxidoreductase, partial [Pseudomonadota bacterium]